MDQIFNDPIISNFLQSIKQSDKKITLKELILLGISVISSKVHAGSCCCNSQINNTRIRSISQCASGNQCGCKCTFVPNISRVFQTGGQWNENMITEIQRMKNRINQLQSYINNPGANRQIPRFVHQGDLMTQNIGTVQTQGQQKRQFTVQPETDPQGVKKQFRHHLDDSQVRKALINPYAKSSPIKQKRKERKQQIDKQHQIQKQRDEQELRKIRNKNEQGTIGGGGIGGMHANINEQQSSQEQDSYQQQRIKNKSKSKEKEISQRNTHNNIKFKNVQDKSQGKNSRNALGQILAEQNIHTINTIHSSKKGYSQNRSHNPQQASHKSSVLISNATSKIKSLIQRDKNRSRNHKNLKNSAFMKKSGSRQTAQEKYCQFEYSDQQYSEEEQSSYNNYHKEKEGPCPMHDTTGKQSSNFSQHQVSGFVHEKQEKQERSKKGQSKKQFKNLYKQTRKKMKESIKHQQQQQEEYEDEQNNENEKDQIQEQSQIDKQNDHESDAVSQSSSFSRFSMSSRRDRERQTGKISGLRRA